MKATRLLFILFALAAFCFAIGTINHICSTGEGIVSSLLLMLGCLCAAIAFYRKK
jgi:hypothetical protein